MERFVRAFLMILPVFFLGASDLWGATSARLEPSARVMAQRVGSQVDDIFWRRHAFLPPQEEIVQALLPNVGCYEAVWYEGIECVLPGTQSGGTMASGIIGGPFDSVSISPAEIDVMVQEVAPRREQTPVPIFGVPHLWHDSQGGWNMVMTYSIQWKTYLISVRLAGVGYKA